MRLFIAITFSDRLRSDLHAATARLRGSTHAIRWLDPDTYHITLKFLGPVRDALVPELEAGLGAAARATDPFELLITGAGAFPSVQRPRVVWLGLQAGPALDGLQAAVEQAIAPLGFPTEARPFHPHITIGRLAAHAKPPDLRGLERQIDPAAYQPVQVHSIELMESKTSSKGARYEAIASAPLGKK